MSFSILAGLSKYSISFWWLYTYPPAGSGSRSRAWSDMFWLLISDRKQFLKSVTYLKTLRCRVPFVHGFSQRSNLKFGYILKSSKCQVPFIHGFAQRNDLKLSTYLNPQDVKFLSFTDLLREAIWKLGTYLNPQDVNFLSFTGVLREETHVILDPGWYSISFWWFIRIHQLVLGADHEPGVTWSDTWSVTEAI